MDKSENNTNNLQESGKVKFKTIGEKIRQEFVDLLINQYGYKLNQMSTEEKLTDKTNNFSPKADIVIWKDEFEKQKKLPPIIIVECKPVPSLIINSDFYQGLEFAKIARAQIFIASNLSSTKFYKLTYLKDVTQYDELLDIPKANDWSNPKNLNEILSKINEVTRVEFSKILFRCHNIIRNNDKLSPESAFDEISKILFMKILYERKHAKERTLYIDDYDGLRSEYLINKAKEKEIEIRSIDDLSVKKINEENLSILPFYKYLFEETKIAFTKDEIFEPNDTFKIRESSFLQIVKELEVYNLSYISDDIKGIAFEEFLGRTFRGELGQFFTPRTIVDYMVEILDPDEFELCCDPCCGSGGFLIKIFEYVREKIEKDIENQKRKFKKTYFDADFYLKSEIEKDIIVKKVDNLIENLNRELDLNNENGRLYQLSHRCIFGTDANPRMARTSKMNMIMHGDGHGGVHHHDGLLNINGVFDGRFDVILTNPPFGARIEKTLRVQDSDIPSDSQIEHYKSLYYNEDYEVKVVNPIREWAKHKTPILNLFEVGKMSGLTEVLFIERCLNLLKPGGRMGIVLPEGVLNNSALQRVREFFEGKAKLINITSIPPDVFIASGAIVKPSLVFFRKFTDEEAIQYNAIAEKTNAEIELQYKPEIEKINKQLADKEQILRGSKDKEALTAARKKYKEAIRQIEQQMADDIRTLIKERFDYPIPVVEVEKAGISSTGSKIDNELIDIAKEFKEYRLTQKLWKSKIDTVSYPIIEEQIMRIVGAGEPEAFYGQ